MLSDFTNTIKELISDSGFAKGDPLQYVMILIACFLIYLAIAKIRTASFVANSLRYVAYKLAFCRVVSS